MYPKCLMLFSCLLIASLVRAQNSSPNVSANSQTFTTSVSTSDSIYTAVDSAASFPGGLLGWRAYVIKNLHGQIPVENGAKPDIYPVKIRFVVNRDGSTHHFQKLTKFGHEMEKEVIRIIELGPRWIPALKDGKIVKSYQEQVVTFVVDDMN